MDCPICGQGYGHKDGCPEAEPIREKVCLCDLCDEYIYEGDIIIDYDGIKYHEDCFLDEYRHEA